MSDHIRVFIADDSAVVRRIVTDTLRKAPDIEIVGSARNGQQALELIEVKKPDVVVLDIEMPVMDGLTALRELRKTDRRTPVIMFSSLTTRGGVATLDALSFGASDYVTKPVSAGAMSDSVEYLEKELVPLVLQWGLQSRQRRIPAAAQMHPHIPTPVQRPPAKPTPIEIIAIGSSTGGPNALADVLKGIPGDIGVPIVITQHMPKLFTKLLAERLDKICPLTVREAVHDAPIQPGEVWIAPGDYHLSLTSRGGMTYAQLDQGPKENSCRPAVDVLFRSGAKHCGQHCLAVVLTGMGKDGLEGCRALDKCGAPIIVQNEATCVVWGMPRAVEEAGLANAVLPLTGIADEIIRYAKSKRRPTAKSPSKEPLHLAESI